MLFLTLNHPSAASSLLYGSDLYVQVAPKMLWFVFYEAVSWIFLFSSHINALNPSLICLVAIHTL